MRHPTEGVLRRLLDEPAGVASSDRQHIAGCPQCLDELAAHREGTARGPARTGQRGSGRTARVLRRPAVAALAVALVVTGAGAAAAEGWLPIFQTQRIAPFSVSTEDLVALPDLSAYGDLELTGDPDVRTVPDRAAAAARTGLDVPEVADLPRGVSGEPIFQVGDELGATFTFSQARAASAAAEAGEPLPPVPAGLDGSQVRLLAGPGVAQVWTSSAGVPALVVGRAVAPTAHSSGVEFETARDYLLSLPGLPDEIAEQLGTFAADGSTLPLPVPADRVTTSSTQVGGVPATVLETRDRSFAAVVWVDRGLVTVVAGSLDDDEVLAVARGLR